MVFHSQNPGPGDYRVIAKSGKNFEGDVSVSVAISTKCIRGEKACALIMGATKPVTKIFGVSLNNGQKCDVH